MKVTNWRRKLARALLAAGIWIPGAAYAVEIPLGDPSFEDYDVATLSANGSYAYSDEYRPTSAWVDDLDHAGGYYYEDDGNSNWLYTAAYGSGFRPTPRTGTQAMHGVGYYNGQVTSAVFEADETYIFSLWAQGDNDASGASSRVWMYLFDGSQPFLDATSLVVQRFAPDTGDFSNRDPVATDPESQAGWRQISIVHRVEPGAPEIGNPIGVAFWQAGDGAVDDASLASGVAKLLVNTASGAATLTNPTGLPLSVDYYEILSTERALDDTGWNSLQDQDYEGNGPPGAGNGWEEAGNVGSTVLSESYLQGDSTLADEATIDLGDAFDPSVFGTGNDGDLVFRYGLSNGLLLEGIVEYIHDDFLESDFDRDGDVDGDDFLLWQTGFGIPSGAVKMDGDYDNDGDVDGDDFLGWQGEFGSGSGNGSTAVPEPASVLLAGAGLVGAIAIRRRRRRQ